MERVVYCLVILRADMSCRAYCSTAGDGNGGTLTPGGTVKASKPPLDVYTNADELLPVIFEEGWTPVRETGLGNGDALLVFSRPF